MITFQIERLADVKVEAMPLLYRHWEEIALNKDTVPLDPDWDAYATVEGSGFYHVVTARNGGVLVGYATYLVARNLHYKSLMVAEADIFFLAPEYRQGLSGAKLLAFAEKSLVERGVNKILTRTKLHHDIGPLLERLGFTPIERVYAKMVN